MLKLATLLENPGEPPSDSQYRDPAVLKELGYTGLVVYETTALSGVESPDLLGDGEMRRWVSNHFDHVGQTIEAADRAGLSVYVFYDVPVLPRDVVDRNVAGLTCKHRPSTLCPASEAMLELSARALDAQLRRWPDVAGIALRFGDTDAGRLPYLVGNDLYSPHCPRCSQFGRADRIVALLERFYDLVVRQHGKRLIVRAWNVRPGGLHDSVDLAQRVIDRMPGDEADDRLMLSFKFTHTDFWRYQQWNPCSLLCTERPVIYELQCQREFEGKGGIPNWQAPLWRDGYPETSHESRVNGLAEASKAVNLAGLWAWVRGGGWGGPFVSNEAWIDANVYAVPRLADDPESESGELGREWIRRRLGVEDEDAASQLLDILAHSPEMIRHAFYIGPAARAKGDPWHPSADWVQDDVLDANAAWRMIQRLPDDQLDAVVAEKQAAAAQIAADRAHLQQLVGDRNHPKLERLLNTLLYTESFFEALRDLLAGLVAYRRYQKSKNAGAADIVRQKLFAAQAHWNHHTQRFSALPGAATAFRERGFWDLTQRILAEVGG